jgi:hypothetical protein
VEPSPSQVVVHAVLDAGSRDQLVLLERTHSGVGRRGSGSFVGGEEPVLNAEVTLTTPTGESLVASEDRRVDSTSSVLGLYRISLDRYAVSLVPGGIYTLRVRVPGGEEVTGTATLPRGPALVPADTESFDAATDSLRLTWTPAVGAARHLVRIRSRFDGAGCCYDVNYSEFADSTFTLSGRARTLDNDPIFLARTTATAIVVAVDANYYEYYRVLSDPFIGAPPSRLVGGQGVFGAVVPVRVRTLKVR